MASRISHTTIDARDAYAQSEWWKQVLVGYTDVPGDPNEPGHEECMIVPPSDGAVAGAPTLLFIDVPEDKQLKNRLHLDLRPTDRPRDDEVERLIALGATQLGDFRRPDGTGWITLADPEGNEFCILRSDGEVAEHDG